MFCSEARELWAYERYPNIYGSFNINIKRKMETFKRYLYFFRPGLNTLLFSENNNSRYTRWQIFTWKGIKLKDMENLAYIEAHKIFGICSNRTYNRFYNKIVWWNLKHLSLGTFILFISLALAPNWPLLFLVRCQICFSFVDK